jgi:hypothetical protein
MAWRSAIRLSVAAVGAVAFLALGVGVHPGLELVEAGLLRARMSLPS